MCWVWCLLDACFCAGTLLRTPGGLQAIETFVAGDRVLSRDEHDPRGWADYKVVEEVFERLGRVWHLTAGGRLIRTTGEHPFHEATKGWVACYQPAEGDRLVCEDGSTILVEEVVDTGTVEVVYNLRVADWHTYFVGGEDWGFSVWAHNAYIVLYHFNADYAHDKLRHWGIEVISEKDRVYADLANDKKGQPTGADAKKLDTWIAWAKKSSPWAKVRVFPSSQESILTKALSKQLVIKEEDAVKAIALARRLVGESVSQKWDWSLDGHSCFEFIASILRVAKPDEVLPSSPNGNAAIRDNLLNALNAIMDR